MIVIVLEVPFYQVLLFEDLNNFFLIRDDREVKYGKENRYVNQANWINQRQNLIESYNKINILSRNKKYLIL